MPDVSSSGSNADDRSGISSPRPEASPPSSTYYKALRTAPDAEDLELHKRNCCADLVTERLGQLVPLLKFVGFRVEQMAAGKTVLTVSLLETAMNQNGTHQAAVFYLLADYTLGVGMFATLPGCYTIGVHDRCRALPVQFWLRAGNVRHLTPGTGVIRGEVSIPPSKIAIMREQLVARGRCEIRETVNIFQGDQLVAVADHEMGLYADLPRIADTRVSMTQIHRLKASALMIAGLRDDPTSAALAQDQGAAIARRMTRATPQLPTLVAARSQSLRGYLRSDGKMHQQVLVLGVGLDSKPIEFSRPSQTWYLCDHQEMLRERAARITRLDIGSGNTVAVPVDLRMSGWTQKIVAAGFEPAKPSLVVLEGVSMYLAADELRRILECIHSLCGHPSSRLWIDHITEDVLGMALPEVRNFLSSMARLGEPFVTGFADAAAFAKEGWRTINSQSAAEVLGIDEAVHREYRFALLAANLTSPPGQPQAITSASRRPPD